MAVTPPRVLFHSISFQHKMLLLLLLLMVVEKEGGRQC